MASRRQLDWIQRNRGADGVTARRLADVIKETLPLQLKHTAALSRLTTALAAGVDDEFREHCRIGGLERGLLTIHVSPPELLWPIRTRWALDLHDLLIRGLPRAGVRRIQFVAGNSGLCLR